jgi:hypothetical protein
MTNPAPFLTWLLDQCDRSGPIGDLARDAAWDHAAGDLTEDATPATVRDRLEAESAIPEAYRALDVAATEWEKATTTNPAGLPYEIVKVRYTKDIDDPDTQEQSREVIAAFSDPDFAEQVHSLIVPTQRNLRVMVTGVRAPAGFTLEPQP